MSKKLLHEVIDNLLQQIDEVFTDVKCPQWDEVTYETHVWEFESFDNNGHLSDWHDLTLEILECHTDVLCMLKPKGFLFFFPAFMRCGLLEHKDSGGDSLIWYCARALGRVCTTLDIFFRNCYRLPWNGHTNT